MPEPELFPCFGVQALGLCSYDPASPSNVYFGLGGAVAALAFTLAIQQFVKPIYKFRLRVYGIQLSYLVVVVLTGVACAFVAAVLPNLDLSLQSPFHYPILWELIGALFIVIGYGASAFLALAPARIVDLNLVRFIQAGAALLSAASDVDRIDFAEDLLRKPRNLTRLIKYSAA